MSLRDEVAAAVAYTIPEGGSTSLAEFVAYGDLSRLKPVQASNKNFTAVADAVIALVRAEVEKEENPWVLCEGEYPAAFKAIGFNFAKASILEALKR